MGSVPGEPPTCWSSEYRNMLFLSHPGTPNRNGTKPWYQVTLLGKYTVVIHFKQDAATYNRSRPKIARWLFPLPSVTGVSDSCRSVSSWGKQAWVWCQSRRIRALTWKRIWERELWKQRKKFSGELNKGQKLPFCREVSGEKLWKFPLQWVLGGYFPLLLSDTWLWFFLYIFHY